MQFNFLSMVLLIKTPLQNIIMQFNFQYDQESSKFCQMKWSYNDTKEPIAEKVSHFWWNIPRQSRSDCLTFVVLKNTGLSYGGKLDF